MKFSKPIAPREPSTVANTLSPNTPAADKPTPSKDAAHLVKMEEIARLLNVSERQVQKMMRDRAIPFVALGRRCIRFDPREVVAFVKRQYGIQAFDCETSQSRA